MAKQKEVDETDQKLLDSPNPFVEFIFEDSGRPAPTQFGLGWTADIANNIGRIMVAYSALEYGLYSIFACLNKATPKESYIEFFEQRKINNKKALFDRAAKSAGIPAPFVTAFSKVWKRMRGAATLRTEFAHAHYSASGEKLYRLTLTGQGTKWSEVRPRLFVETLSRYRILDRDILILLGLTASLDPKYVEKLNQLPTPPNTPHLQITASRGRQRLSRSAEIADIARRLGLRYWYDHPRTIAQFSWGLGDDRSYLWRS